MDQGESESRRALSADHSVSPVAYLASLTHPHTRMLTEPSSSWLPDPHRAGAP